MTRVSVDWLTSRLTASLYTWSTTSVGLTSMASCLVVTSSGMLQLVAVIALALALPVTALPAYLLAGTVDTDGRYLSRDAHWLSQRVDHFTTQVRAFVRHCENTSFEKRFISTQRAHQPHPRPQIANRIAGNSSSGTTSSWITSDHLMDPSSSAFVGNLHVGVSATTTMG